jgi:hypothetical protein
VRKDWVRVGACEREDEKERGEERGEVRDVLLGERVEGGVERGERGREDEGGVSMW